MNATLQARALWGLWLKEQRAPARAQTFPFYERVQSLLTQRTLSPVLSALFAEADQLEAVETLNELVAVVHRMAQWDQAEDKSTFHSMLVALPAIGDRTALAAPQAVWTGVEHYLLQRFQQRLKARGQGPLGLAITPLPQWLSPETCATLDLDEVYRLTQELSQGQPGPLAQQLMATEAARGAPVSQHLSVAVITHNARQLRPHEALDQWLNELDPQDWVWQRHMGVTPAQMEPPLPFIEALTETLLQRLESEMATRCLALDTVLDQAQVAWTDIMEDEASDTMRLTATVDEAPVMPVVIPCNWFALTGPVAIGRVLGMWDYPVDVIVTEEDTQASSEPEPLATVVPLRRR